MKLVEANPRVPVSSIQATIAQQFEYQIQYKKGWRARDKALRSAYSDYDKSYNELPTLLMAITQFIPGTIVRYETNDALNRQGQLMQGLMEHGFTGHSHILLVAVAQDGESNVIPIAFAIVEGETANAWNFFLTNLREHVARRRGMHYL
ncbi:hypothetical protein V6N12_007438 [Hibiscus sabdariffa]|uniref:MULE transposase domain-containing protein n=1 Tax=Hibiscus sabdariffa TaxID=183260 RepID=A0ABR2F1U9_9ROSI